MSERDFIKAKQKAFTNAALVLGLAVFGLVHGAGMTPEVDELTKVAIDYGAKAHADALAMLQADGFTRSDQCAYIVTMAGFMRCNFNCCASRKTDRAKSRCAIINL